MPETAGSQTSATYVANLVKALGQLKRLDEALAVAPANVAEMIRRPMSQVWWDLPQMVGLTEVIVKVGGPDLVRQSAKHAVVESTSRILRPFIAVLTAMGGTSPRAYFQKWADLTATSSRNIAFDWQPGGRGTGKLVINYPAPVPDVFAQYWHGGFDVVFEQTRRVGTSTLEPRLDPRRFSFTLTWRK